MGLLADIISQPTFDAEETFTAIDAYEKEQPYDVMISTARAVAYFFAQDYQASEKYIQAAIEKMPSNYINHFYYALIASAQGKYLVAARECYIANAFATQFGAPAEWEQLLQQMNDTLRDVTQFLSPAQAKELDQIRNILKSPGSFFPAYYSQQRWTVFLGDFLYFDPNHTYNDYFCIWPQSHTDLFSYTMMCLLKQSGQYNAYAVTPAVSWKAIKTKKLQLQEQPCILAVASTTQNQQIQVAVPRESTQHCCLQVPDIYHYLRMDKNAVLSSANEFIVSSPVPLIQKPGKKKLILNIFLDGLSQRYLEETNYEFMPHTKKFFSGGVIFKNCFAAAEWTHPSVASLCTGLYTTHHHIIYRSSAYQFPKQTFTASEIFHEDGYFTSSISGSVGTSPYMGALRGFDHSIYKSCLGFPDSHLIDDALDHFDAFFETNQFLFLGLFDIHKSKEDSQESALSFDLSQQTAIDFRTALSKTADRELKSVRKHYHKPTIYKYQAAMRQNDRQLKEIYDYILSHYQEDEYIVTLFSDHGVPFIDHEEFLLKKNQTNSVLMIRGSGAPAFESEEYINHFDYLPAVAKLAGVAFDFSGHDCVLPRVFGGTGRDFAYTESIYHGQHYEAVVRDESYEYRFETKANTDIDGSIDLSKGYTSVILENSTDEVIRDEGLTQAFEAIIFDHIKENIKY